MKRGLRTRRQWPLMGLILPLLAVVLVVMLLVDMVFHHRVIDQQLLAQQQRLLMGQAKWIEQRILTSKSEAFAGMDFWQLGHSAVFLAIVDRQLQPLASANALRPPWQRFDPIAAQRALDSATPVSQHMASEYRVQLYYPLLQLLPQFSGRLLFLELDLMGNQRQIDQALLHNHWRLVALAGLSFLLLAWLCYRWLVLPLRQLQLGVAQFHESSSETLPLGPVKEFHQLWRHYHQSNQRLRRAYLQLAATEQRWLFAIESLQAGVWEWHIEHDQVYFSHHWKSMLGYRDDELAASFAAFEQRVHPSDRPRMLMVLRQHLQDQQGVMTAKIRLQHRDGHYLWVKTQGLIVEWDERGKPLRMVGTHIDITDKVNRELAQSTAS